MNEKIEKGLNKVREVVAENAQLVDIKQTPEQHHKVESHLNKKVGAKPINIDGFDDYVDFKADQIVKTCDRCEFLWG